MSTIYSNTVLNAQADAAETAIGAAPTLEIRAGTPPAAIGTADSGTLLATMTLPSDWLGAASAGVKTLLGTWSATAAAAGKATYYRIKAGATAHVQGLVSMPWQASSAVVVGEYVSNGGNLYRCTTAGTTASSGGPSGTGATISDGTAVWAYQQAGTDMSMDNTAIASGQSVTINSYSLSVTN